MNTIEKKQAIAAIRAAIKQLDAIRKRAEGWNTGIEIAGPLPVVGSGGVVGLPALSSNQIDILKHTSRTGRYVSDEEPDLRNLANRGLLRDYGPQILSGGMRYYVMTSAGRAALNEHRQSARPIPRQPEPNIRSQP